MNSIILENMLHPISVDLLKQESIASDFIFILDGFDEIATRTSDVYRKTLLAELNSLVACGATIVLTSRPSYFSSAEEIGRFIDTLNAERIAEFDALSTETIPASRGHTREMQVKTLRAKLTDRYTNEWRMPTVQPDKFSILQVQTFDETQIDAYLSGFDDQFQKECDCDWRYVKSFLLSIYDLRDLMKRPILLGMIKDTVLAAAINIRKADAKGGAAWLYEAYTEANMDRDWHKGKSRQLLSVDERQRLCEQIALNLLRSGSNTVSPSEFNSIVSLVTSSEQHLVDTNRETPDMDSIATDGRLSAFLTIEEDGYRFAHQSFFEFFCARAIAYRNDVRGQILPTTQLTFQTLRFLGEFSDLDPSLYEYCVKLYTVDGPSSSALAETNGIGATWTSSQRPEAASIRQLELRLWDIVSKSFIGWKFVDVLFSQFEFRQCEFHRARLEACLFDECVFSQNLFLDSQISYSRASGLEFLDCQFRDFHIRSLSSGRDSIRIFNSSIANTTIECAGSTNIAKCSGA